MWPSLVGHYVRDVGAAGSNPVIPTKSTWFFCQVLFSFDFWFCGSQCENTPCFPKSQNALAFCNPALKTVHPTVFLTPLSTPVCSNKKRTSLARAKFFLEQGTGVEPALTAWEAAVIPIYQPCEGCHYHSMFNYKKQVDFVEVIGSYNKRKKGVRMSMFIRTPEL